MRTSYACLLAMTVTGALAQDWPQYGGLARDGLSTETGLAGSWPQSGPAVLWEVKGLGGGFASPVVAEGRVFIMGREATLEPRKGWNDAKVTPGPDVLYCLDQKDGHTLWKHEFALLTAFDKPSAWCTPVVDGGFVFARGADGEIACLAAKDGAPVWSWPKDRTIFKAVHPNQLNAGARVAGTPLVTKESVIFESARGKLTALKRESGEQQWEQRIAPYEYGGTNPFILNVGGKPVLIARASALDPATGKELLKVDPAVAFVGGHTGNRIVVGFIRNLKIPKEKEEEEKKAHGNQFMFEAGLACLAFEFQADGKLAANKVWEWLGGRDRGFDKCFGGPLILDGHVYAFLGAYAGTGRRMVCLELETGKERWKTDLKSPLGYSNPLCADGKIYYFAGAQAKLVVVAADPQAYKELGSALVCGSTWSSPALAHGALFVRDDTGVVKCLDLKAK